MSNTPRDESVFAELLRARLPATYVLMAVLVLVHVGSGLALLRWDLADWPEALVMPRGVRARVVVGGQHRGFVDEGDVAHRR